MSHNDEKKQQYGNSVSYCDYILTHQLMEIQPRQVVDFGAGGGKNGRITRQILGNSVKLIAIEGDAQTATMLSGTPLYDEVCHNLIQSWVSKNLSQYDLAIFGDVLEHLPPTEIHPVVRQSIKMFENIIIICPLHDIFQDDLYGNPLETHRTYITSHFFDRYNPVEKHIVKGSNFTIMNILIRSENRAEPIYRRFSWFLFHNVTLALQSIGMARSFVNFLKQNFSKFRWLLRG